MNIQGVNVLSQKIIYSPQWFGKVAIICAIILVFFFVIILTERYQIWAITPATVCLILFIIFLVITSEENHSTFLNKPSKIQYDIEITDSNAWKELGPNYRVLKRLYEDKEFYCIEGDYINDDT